MDANHSMLLSCKTLGGRLRIAAKHNLREISGRSIDASRSYRNVVLAGPGTSASVVELAERRMDETGLDLTKQRQRKGGTLSAEVLFGLPATTPVDTVSYFRACVAWVMATFGDAVVLSAVIHNDESAPHCHVLMLPMRGGAWRASKVFGQRHAIVAMQAEFFGAVAARFGLRPPVKRLALADKEVLAAAVLKNLKETPDSILMSAVWPTARAMIEADPRRWAEQLGIETVESPKRQRTMTQIFTSKGKGAKKEETAIGDLSGATQIIYPVLADSKMRHQHAELPRRGAPEQGNGSHSCSEPCEFSEQQG